MAKKGTVEKMSELEKIDIIRNRLGTGYKEAKAALDASGGDVVQALISLEEKAHEPVERFQVKGNDLLDQIKGLLQKGQGYRIKVKHGERTVFEVPASVGALGLVGVLASSQIAILSALASVAGMANNYTLEVDHSVNFSEGKGFQEDKVNSRKGEQDI
ncbi:DUF4342 domain-containing protein [Pelotomaculum sp. PtaB.Bin117]|uniref:DUF4342 domain-containing protein n=1 Tax=Pelotomaculum sp. PtaB.Bin117 TaxID=1811694 RepID=UPI00257BACA2|nr:DUF4342 domain-containing protein [Pelotomaculum sp. PtaB.Bin117]